MPKAENFELELRRENLLKSTARLHEIISACKTATRAATEHKTLAVKICNVPMDEAEQERVEKRMAYARDAAERALKSILVPGLEYDFRNGHVYCMVRVRDKENRRAVSL